MRVRWFLIAVLAGLLALRWRRRRLPARAVIISPADSTVMSRAGAVRSVQTAELTARRDEVEPLWKVENLENLGRTYWRFLSRVTLGLIRVVYGEDERRVVFLTPRLTLLRFEAPQYTFDTEHGRIVWPIRDGLLVAGRGRGRGYLAIDVLRLPRSAEDASMALRIEVEVRNFYPAIAFRFSRPVYEATQSVVHVLVTQAFLRSLAKLDLARSRVGKLAAAQPPGPPVAPASAF